MLNLEHYLDALTQEARSVGWFDTAGAVAGTRTLAGQFRSFLGDAEATERQAGGNARHDRRAAAGPRSTATRGCRQAIEKALEMSCFDVEAVRLLLDAERNGKRSRARRSRSGLCAVYDRPQPTTRNYDQLLRNYSGKRGDSMSAATVAVQQATIRQYAKDLRLRDDGRAVCALAEEAVKAEAGASELSGSAAGGGGGRTGTERGSAADSGGAVSRR